MYILYFYTKSQGDEDGVRIMRQKVKYKQKSTFIFFLSITKWFGIFFIFYYFSIALGLNWSSVRLHMLCKLHVGVRCTSIDCLQLQHSLQYKFNGARSSWSYTYMSISLSRFIFFVSIYASIYSSTYLSVWIYLSIYLSLFIYINCSQTYSGCRSLGFQATSLAPPPPTYTRIHTCFLVIGILYIQNN